MLRTDVDSNFSWGHVPWEIRSMTGHDGIRIGFFNRVSSLGAERENLYEGEIYYYKSRDNKICE
jgi:hypothetical protein